MTHASCRRDVSKHDRDIIRAALQALTVPEGGSAWVGPFEQLQGAGYSLLAAIRRGIYTRDLSDYHARVRKVIITSILEQDTTGRVRNKSAMDNALAGFYFNCAIQRIVWASERLAKTIIGIPCGCGRPPHRHAKEENFGKLRKAARDRTEHLRTQDNIEMPQTREMLRQFGEKRYRRDMPFDRNSVLGMLRYDVNNRKHPVFGPSARDRRSAGKAHSAEPKTWSTAPQDLQMQFACEAFSLVVRAYNELRSWQPSASAPNGR